jgi:hypothetical protein
VQPWALELPIFLIQVAIAIPVTLALVVVSVQPHDIVAFISHFSRPRHIALGPSCVRTLGRRRRAA